MECSAVCKIQLFALEAVLGKRTSRACALIGGLGEYVRFPDFAEAEAITRACNGGVQISSSGAARTVGASDIGVSIFEASG